MWDSQYHRAFMVQQEGGNRLVLRHQASANSVKLEHVLPRETGAFLRKNGREKLRWLLLTFVVFFSPVCPGTLFYKIQ